MLSGLVAKILGHTGCMQAHDNVCVLWGTPANTGGMCCAVHCECTVLVRQPAQLQPASRSNPLKSRRVGGALRYTHQLGGAQAA
jgi:hypothetical protein